MIHYIEMCGPAGWALLVVSVVVIIVIARTVISLARQGTENSLTHEYKLNALVFWGFMGAVLGFLGQTSAIHRAMTVIIPARSISPELMDKGFRESFLPSFWGFAIFAFSIIVSLAFRLVLSRRSKGGGPATDKPAFKTVVWMLMLLCVVSIPSLALADREAAVPDVLISKVWTGKVGPDDIVFQLWVTGDGSLSGEAHTLRGGRHRTQSPATRVVWEDPEIVLHMNTGVVFRGKVNTTAARIDGELIYQGKQLMQLPLDGIEAGGVKGLLARPVTPGQPVYSYTLPTATGDGWQCAGPETVGLEPAQLEGLVIDVIEGKAGFLHSLLIASKGKLILEEYFHGYEREDLHRLASATKSVSSLITGIAIDKGLLGGVDVAVIDFFPDLQRDASKGWEEVTLGNLLTMSIGTAWTQEEASRTHGAGDAFFRELVSRDFAHTPGERWQYVSANVNLLGGVIKRATGMHANEFAAAHLFGPLGIEKWNWDYGMVDGYRLMDGSLMLRPRDMAKLGALVAGHGSWDGKQIVSEEWMEASTAPQIVPSENDPERYGYLWWLFYIPSSTGTRTAVVANGAGSQIIAAFPELELVVVTTGANDENGMQFAIGKLFSTHVLSNMKVTTRN